MGESTPKYFIRVKKSGKEIGAMTFSITTLSIMGLFETLSINDTEHKRHSA